MSAAACAPAPSPATRPCCATTYDPPLAPGPSSSSPRWRCRASMTGWPSGGRRDGKPGGLAPQHILAVHRCLHRALAQAVTWRLVAANVATDATPPPVPTAEGGTLTPRQVAGRWDG